MGKEHDEHEGVGGGHGGGGGVETGPCPSSVERMVRDEPLVGHHGDPGVLLHAPADKEHASPVVKGKTGGLVPVWPETLDEGEVELDAPGVVHGDAGKKGVEAATCADVHGVVEVVGAHADGDVGMVDVDTAMRVDLETTTPGEESHGASGIALGPEVAQEVEPDGLDAFGMEEGDVVGSMFVAVVVYSCLDGTLGRGVERLESGGNVGGIKGGVLLAFIWEFFAAREENDGQSLERERGAGRAHRNGCRNSFSLCTSLISISLSDIKLKSQVRLLRWKERKQETRRQTAQVSGASLSAKAGAREGIGPRRAKRQSRCWVRVQG